MNESTMAEEDQSRHQGVRHGEIDESKNPHRNRVIIPLSGYLSDRIGRKRMYLLGGTRRGTQR
jgi:hypothetical protein